MGEKPELEPAAATRTGMSTTARSLGALLACLFGSHVLAQPPLVFTVDGTLVNPAPPLFRTIQAAVDAIPVKQGTPNPNIAMQAVTIQVRDTATYSPVTIRTRGGPTRILRLESDPANAARAKIEGPHGYWQGAIDIRGAAYWHIRGLEVDGRVAANPSDDSLGIRVRPQAIDDSGRYAPEAASSDLLNSHHVVIESCDVHHNSHTGIQIESSYHCAIINCDAHHNTDEQGEASGDNADGIQVVYAMNRNANGGVPWQSHSNVIIGCRSWENSDDGYDCWESYPVVFRGCQAWKNGLPVLNPNAPGFLGNGVGFKLGRGGDGNTVINCMAWDNDQDGFKSNSSAGVCRFYNCTAFRNTGDGFVSRYAQSDHPHVMINNLSDDVHVPVGHVVEENNSWNGSVGYTFDPADFESVPPVNGYVPPARLPGGQLVPDGLLRPKPSSPPKGYLSYIPPTVYLDTTDPNGAPLAHIGAVEVPWDGTVAAGEVEGRTDVGAIVDPDTLEIQLALYVATMSPANGPHELFVGYSGITDPTFPATLQIDDAAVSFSSATQNPGFFAIPLKALGTSGVLQVIAGVPPAHSRVVRLRSDV